ncbi:MAG TPA: FAD-dependent oxidoreductase [Gaiellaceae bacterium]
MSEAVVVGAGVFGASTARELRKRGWRVTVVEQYAPGTVRSASGGDTRLLRMAHGDAEWYTELARRARTLWLELQESSGVHIWEPVGLAWFARRDGGFETQSRATLARLGVEHEWLEPEAATGLYPSLGVDDLHGVLYEPDAGVLHARRATQLLVEDAERLGARVEPRRVTAADPPDADVVVWACGAWLPALFPGELELVISRREVFFFGGGPDWTGTPGFCEYDAPFYGHGDVGGLGVKIAPDGPGEQVDPDTLERVPSDTGRREAHAFAARRFPALAEAPVIGARVCQYSLTGDSHFVVARHPEQSSWWLVGGGSGHGFKHGPALGEYIADCVEGVREPEPFHALGPRAGSAGLRSAALR